VGASASRNDGQHRNPLVHPGFSPAHRLHTLAGFQGLALQLKKKAGANPSA
jgi:hypothetical protein